MDEREYNFKVVGDHKTNEFFILIRLPIRECGLAQVRISLPKGIIQNYNEHLQKWEDRFEPKTLKLFSKPAIMEDDIDEDAVEDNRCPKCKQGSLVERTNRETNKTFIGCNEWPACDYTKAGGSNPAPSYKYDYDEEHEYYGDDDDDDDFSYYTMGEQEY